MQLGRSGKRAHKRKREGKHSLTPPTAKFCFTCYLIHPNRHQANHATFYRQGGGSEGVGELPKDRAGCWPSQISSPGLSDCPYHILQPPGSIQPRPGETAFQVGNRVQALGLTAESQSPRGSVAQGTEEKGMQAK